MAYELLPDDAPKAGGYTLLPDTPGLREKIAAQIAADPISVGARNFNDGASFLGNFNAGAGKAITDIGRGFGQFVGIVSRDDVKESRRLDAPLMKTGGGVSGNIATNLLALAPASALPGAATVPGAAALGAFFGLVQPSESTAETALNTGLGAAGGAAGQWVANKAGAIVHGQTKEAATKLQQTAQKVDAARQANSAGYVIPPEDLGGGVVTKAASGLSGKIKTAQVASERNQAVTNSLARRALGIADDTPLNIETLKAVRDQASKAYDAVKQAGTVASDAALTSDLDGIVAKFQGAAKSFPGLKKNEVVDVIDTLRVPSFDAGDAIDATRVLRDAADTAFGSGNKSAGKAYRAASDAIEAALERHLAAQGNPDALGAFQVARKTIAKTYTVERALNPMTGDVSAQVLGGLLKRGKPLEGELRLAAQTGLAFPKATQALKESPKTLSPLDWTVAGGGVLSGHPAGAIGLVARPATRAALLSSPVQRNMIENASKAAAPNPIARLLSNDRLTIPMGLLGGPALSPYLLEQ